MFWSEAILAPSWGRGCSQFWKRKPAWIFRLCAPRVTSLIRCTGLALFPAMFARSQRNESKITTRERCARDVGRMTMLGPREPRSIRARRPSPRFRLRLQRDDAAPHRAPIETAVAAECVDIAAGMGQGAVVSSVSGEVAKWLGNGLQNRYTRVRIPSSPP